MPRSSWLSALLLIAVLVPQAAQSDPVARHAMSAAGSERLGLFAMSRMFDRYDRDPRIVSALRTGLARQGFYFDGTGPRLLSHGAWMSPRVGHDGNINGGMVNDRFGYGGLVFEADPAATAKSGWVGGLSFGQRLRLAVANGMFLDMYGRGEVEYSPRHRIWTNRANLTACIRRNLKGWTFVDLCRDMQDSERKLGRSHLRTTSLSISSILETAGAYHELAATLERSDYGYMEQTGVTLALKTTFDHIMPHISIFVAQPVVGKLAFRRRIDAGVRIRRDDRFFGLHVWAQEADGGYFLGQERRDRNMGLSVSTDLTQTTSAEIALVRNISNQDFFDYSQMSFTVNFRPLTW